MNENIQKVTAFIIRESNGIKELLVFKHPTAGIQIPAGTVEKDEDIETAVKREVYEETGLQFVEIENYLGCMENELENNQRIIAETTPGLYRIQLKMQFPTSERYPKGLPLITFPHRRISHTFRTLSTNMTNFTNPYVH